MDLVLYVSLEFFKSSFFLLMLLLLFICWLPKKRKRKRKVVELGGWIGGEDLGETEIERKP